MQYSIKQIYCTLSIAHCSRVVRGLAEEKGENNSPCDLFGHYRGLDGVGDDNPLQYSCLEISMDRGAWWAKVHWVARSRTQPSTHMCACTLIHTYIHTHTHTHTKGLEKNELHCLGIEKTLYKRGCI